MRKLIVGIVFFIVSLIQINFGNNIAIWGIKPNLYIIFVACFALFSDGIDGAFIGLIAGIIQDIVSGVYIGRYSLISMYFGMAVVYMKKRFVGDNIFVAMTVVFFGTILYEFILYFFSVFVINQSSIWYAFSRIIFIEAVYNTVLTLLVFPIVVKVDEWFYRDTVRLSKR